MKVIRLQSQNIMRLVAVDITPEGHLITIGGKNDAGKSSVLNSLAMALGGKDLVPIEPLRQGESKGQVVVDLGDFVVTRKFYREPIRKDEDKAATADNIVSWSETKSTLVVTNKEGNAKFNSPQALLDSVLGKLTFDPLAFSKEDPKRQNEILRRLVGLDFAPLEQKRSAAVSERTRLKRIHDLKYAQAQMLPKHQDAPEAEVSVDEIVAELHKAAEYEKLATEADRSLAVATAKHDGFHLTITQYAKQIETLEAQIQGMRENLVKHQANLADAARDVDALKITAEAARAVVPDSVALQTRVREIKDGNVKFHENLRYAQAQQEMADLSKLWAEQDGLVNQLDEDKQRLLETAKYPVEGLSLSDNGIMLHDLPFTQASSSEQLRVSVAIAIALNPKLKVLFIRNGNLLDEDKLKLVAEQAAEADMQVWMEYVTSKPEGVQVMLEDGAQV